ncbi:MAG: hypothetical protein EPO25_18635 [Gammaproteobacteria bacterium]|nr:MAG: hypothetical protein EPO25_18635 [Gammaproteobacteria bacterium]
MNQAAWESLHRATVELAKAHSIKQRLMDAYSRHLKELAPAELPGSIRADFESLCQRMTEVRPLRGETAVAATVRKMSVDEADACAVRIVALLDALHRDGGKSDLAPWPRRSGELPIPSRIPALVSVSRA